MKQEEDNIKIKVVFEELYERYKINALTLIDFDIALNDVIVLKEQAKQEERERIIEEIIRKLPKWMNTWETQDINISQKDFIIRRLKKELEKWHTK